ncbi:OmpW family protein [Duganella sp. FT3S]|uniref:OmpW family protein n=1 Tax=Rugamonas fusca TaxID=2758568 RepID=A0A7W2EK46_9BURK|nr:OmpW family outer membrane protein [Rugamonas fusca]MBA5607410.1 OmpW family protein [Rugamonas fusca]
MQKSAAAIILVSLGMLAGNVMAEESPWLVRARAVHLDPANKSDPVGGVGASDLIHVSSKTIPEVDISYFFTRNVSAELVLTYPQKHDVSLNGANIGTFKHLPPTLLAQYHFLPDAQLNPYVGAGINYTNITKVELLNGAGGLEHKSFGLALQAGVDYKIDRNWSLNFDVKKVQIRSDVFVSGAKVSNVQIDPWLVGVGVGYRF